MNVFKYDRDWDTGASLYCEEADVSAEPEEKFVRYSDAKAIEKERDFILEQFREMAQAQPYAMVDHVAGPYQCTPGLDTYKWFWWNGAARPIYKGALCDVVLSDGSIHFNVRPDFHWSDCDGLHVIAARHGPNLDYMERVDRPAPRIYAAPIPEKQI